MLACTDTIFGSNSNGNSEIQNIRLSRLHGKKSFSHEWLRSYALHGFTSRWSSLKGGLKQSSWKDSRKLLKLGKHVVESLRLNHSVRSVTSDPSKLHTTMFPQPTEATGRMTSCHAGSFQGWFET